MISRDFPRSLFVSVLVVLVSTTALAGWNNERDRDDGAGHMAWNI